MYKVLLADDEVLIREAIQENMKWEELGFTLCAVCENGRQAIEAIERECPDLVLTDICMPYADGLDVSRYVYENCPQCKVVILSGYNNFEYAKKAIQYQAAEYILKPVTARELSDILVRIRAKLDKEREEQKRKESIIKAYEGNRPYFRERFLNQLIRGTWGQQDIKERFAFYDIRIDGACFSVVQIPYINQNDIADILVFALFNMIEELTESEACCLAFQDLGNVTTLVFWGESEYQVEQEIKRVGLKIQERIVPHLYDTIVVAAGKCVWDIRDLAQSYKNAKRTAEYTFLFEDNAIIFGKELAQRTGQVTIATGDWAEWIFAVMKKNNKDEIENKIQQLFQEIKRGYHTKERVEMYVQNIITRIILFVDEMGVKNESELEWEKKYMEEALRQERLEDLAALLKAFCLEAADGINRDRESLDKNVAERALGFIDKNYKDSSLSLNSVCRNMAVSTSRFSALFKEQTGETFIEALTKKRIETAKELLRTTSMKSYEVAEEVGYSDAHYFGSIFKKNVGMTPKEYAKKRSELC